MLTGSSFFLVNEIKSKVAAGTKWLRDVNEVRIRRPVIEDFNDVAIWLIGIDKKSVGVVKDMDFIVFHFQNWIEPGIRRKPPDSRFALSRNSGSRWSTIQNELLHAAICTGT